MLLHPIILYNYYGNDLICIFITINENFKKWGNYRGKTIYYCGGGITLLCVGEGVMKSTLHP